VVVAGSGAGGLVASIVVAYSGCDVLLLEKGEKLGGDIACSNGQVWVPSNQVELTEGIVDSIETAEMHKEAGDGGEINRKKLDDNLVCVLHAYLLFMAGHFFPSSLSLLFLPSFSRSYI
jgi:flavin-dependent dehydrogenase